MENAKEREFVIRGWNKEIIKLTEEELMFLIDVTVEEEYSYIKEREEKMQGSAKEYLINILQSIYIHHTHKDERIKRLCLIAKSLYIKIDNITNEDAFYIIREICMSKSFIHKFGLLDSFWQENEVTEIKNEGIETVSRARHLKLLELSI
ncbi:hypothetical protein ACJDU8_02445 [Clostridium sp. WILCCON 0269]|uniref:Uncharacterized protein n=1 Tax=Candidatus Clostridium eludens TaxID=3381663 RepID=A0ABW8SGS2_9CLOT